MYCHQFSHALRFVFVPGRVSKAKCLIADAVCLVKNRASLHAISSNSYGRQTLTVRCNIIILILIWFLLCFVFYLFFALAGNPNFKLCLLGVLFGVFVSSLISLIKFSNFLFHLLREIIFYCSQFVLSLTMQ